MNEIKQLRYTSARLEIASDELTHALDFAKAHGLHLDEHEELEYALTLIDRTRQMIGVKIANLNERPDWAAVNGEQHIAIGTHDLEVTKFPPEDLSQGFYTVWFDNCDNLDFQEDVLPFDETFVPGW